MRTYQPGKSARKVLPYLEVRSRTGVDLFGGDKSPKQFSSPYYLIERQSEQAERLRVNDSAVRIRVIAPYVAVHTPRAGFGGNRTVLGTLRIG